MNIYANIDMVKTGKRIENAVKDAGFDVKSIQKYLHLSCPQPVYRWFQGKILPSVDHLYVLSGLLGVHMEDLLVSKQRNVLIVLDQKKAFVIEEVCSVSQMRLMTYYNSLCIAAA